jgi:hypothetical protein
MIELRRCGFAPVATVLSFIAGERDPHESILRRVCLSTAIHGVFAIDRPI